MKALLQKKTMAKSSAIILVSAICFLSFLSVAFSHDDRFFIEGKVYCDTCRIQFFTRVSKFMEGATVKLECKDREGGSVTFSNEAVTDKNGLYSVEVDGDHEEEICEVSLVKSIDPDCADISTNGYGHSSRISCTSNNGITNPVRQANPLGFLKKTPVAECDAVLRELGFTAPDTLA